MYEKAKFHGITTFKKRIISNTTTALCFLKQRTQLFLSNGQSTLHLRYLTFLVVTFNAA